MTLHVLSLFDQSSARKRECARVLYQATPTKHVSTLSASGVHVRVAIMAVNPDPATVQAISTALAGALSPLLQQGRPTATATATLTGHSSTVTQSANVAAG